jgi:hypothetical protein
LVKRGVFCCGPSKAFAEGLQENNSSPFGLMDICSSRRREVLDGGLVLRRMAKWSWCFFGGPPKNQPKGSGTGGSLARPFAADTANLRNKKTELRREIVDMKNSH